MTWRVFMEDNAIIGDFGGGAISRYFIDLNGITIPLLIKGTFDKPSFNLDTEAALKEKIEAGKKALQEKAKDAILGNKSSDELKEEAKDLKDKLKSFF